MRLTSSQIHDGERLPVKHTGDGADLSPHLVFSEVPEKTASFVVIMDDPDAPAGTWVHWVMYDIPKGVRELAESQVQGTQGLSSWKKIGYKGAAPPPGKEHRYIFHLYALDCLLGLAEGATKEQVLKAAEGHVLATAELTCVYSRSS